MCKYCENKKTIRSSNWYGNGQISIDNNGNLYGKDDEVFRINYCPMCGVKLGEQSNEITYTPRELTRTFYGEQIPKETYKITCENVKGEQS